MSRSSWQHFVTMLIRDIPLKYIMICSTAVQSICDGLDDKRKTTLPTADEIVGLAFVDRYNKYSTANWYVFWSINLSISFDLTSLIPVSTGFETGFTTSISNSWGIYFTLL